MDFEAIYRCDFETADIREDARQDYGDDRFVATGWLDGRLHKAIVTYRNGIVRVISLRKANPREVRRHERDTSKLH